MKTPILFPRPTGKPSVGDTLTVRSVKWTGQFEKSENGADWEPMPSPREEWNPTGFDIKHDPNEPLPSYHWDFEDTREEGSE